MKHNSTELQLVLHLFGFGCMFLWTTMASSISCAIHRSLVLFESNVNILINPKWKKSLSKSWSSYSALWLNEGQCWVQYGLYCAGLSCASVPILMGPELSCIREVFNYKEKELAVRITPSVRCKNNETSTDIGEMLALAISYAVLYHRWCC